VLVMDDEPIMRETLSEVLHALGYEAVVTSDGEEAVAQYGDALERGEPFGVVILDLTVPGGIGGRRTLELLRAIDPDVRAIVSSGYSDDPVMANYLDYGFCGVVAKPYTLAELQAALRSVLEP
jgi:CheY-like chemotaxis protein